MLLSPHESKYVDVAQNNSSRRVKLCIRQELNRSHKIGHGIKDSRRGRRWKWRRCKDAQVAGRRYRSEGELSAETPYGVVSGGDSSNGSGGE